MDSGDVVKLLTVARDDGVYVIDTLLLIIIRHVVALSITMCLHYPCTTFRYFYVEAGGICDVQFMDDVQFGRYTIRFLHYEFTAPSQFINYGISFIFFPFFGIKQWNRMHG